MFHRLYHIIIYSFLSFILLVGLSSAQTNDLLLQEKQIYTFADSVAKAIVKGEKAVLKDKMIDYFRITLNAKQFENIIEQMSNKYGALQSYEYKTSGTGTKVLPDGKKVAMYKLWYAAVTTKHKKGQYYLFIEIVMEADHLACSGFALVTFPYGIPDNLR